MVSGFDGQYLSVVEPLGTGGIRFQLPKKNNRGRGSNNTNHRFQSPRGHVGPRPKLDWQNQQQRRGGTPGHQQTDRSPGRGMSRQDSRDDTNDKEEYSTRYYQVLVFG